MCYLKGNTLLAAVEVCLIDEILDGFKNLLEETTLHKSGFKHCCKILCLKGEKEKAQEFKTPEREYVACLGISTANNTMKNCSDCARFFSFLHSHCSRQWLVSMSLYATRFRRKSDSLPFYCAYQGL